MFSPFLRIPHSGPGVAILSTALITRRTQAQLYVVWVEWMLLVVTL